MLQPQVTSDILRIYDTAACLEHYLEDAQNDNS